MNGENCGNQSARPATRPLLAFATLVAIMIAGLGAQSAAAKPLKSPRPGAWNIIAAANTPHGLEVRGGVIGSFRVTRHLTIAGFHLRFTEEGESSDCAGGGGAEGSKPKSGTIAFPAGASAPIIHVSGAWLVAVDTGTLGGGSVQGAEVNLVSPNGNFASQIEVKLGTRTGVRSGDIEWDQQQCGVAFVVKPG